MKAVSDVMSPVTGVVAEVNEACWTPRRSSTRPPMRPGSPRSAEITDQEELMDAAAYEAFIAQ